MPSANDDLNAEFPGNPWYSRGYLPHFDKAEAIQSLTIRLVDSMPQSVLDRWDVELKSFAETGRDVERRRRIENYLDAGHGACWLRNPSIARLIQDALLHFDGQRYRLLAWCVMPNHVHFLIETWKQWPLADLMYSLKAFTAKEANKVLGRRGTFWQREYFDRFMRDEAHLANVVRYIEDNPVKAGLAKRKENWNWSSACGKLTAE